MAVTPLRFYMCIPNPPRSQFSISNLNPNLIFGKFGWDWDLAFRLQMEAKKAYNSLFIPQIQILGSVITGCERGLGPS